MTKFRHVQNSPILAASMHGTPAVGSAKLCGMVQGMELRNFCRSRHLHSAGQLSPWASAHILVIIYNKLFTVTPNIRKHFKSHRVSGYTILVCEVSSQHSWAILAMSCSADAYAWLLTESANFCLSYMTPSFCRCSHQFHAKSHSLLSRWYASHKQMSSYSIKASSQPLLLP